MMTRYVTGKGASVGIIPPPVVIIVAVGVGDGITEVVLEGGGGGAGRERKGGERKGGRKMRSSGHSSSLVYDYQEVSIRPALAPPLSWWAQTNISTPALDGHAAPRVEGRAHVRACVRAQVHVHIFAGSPSIKIQ